MFLLTLPKKLNDLVRNTQVSNMTWINSKRAYKRILFKEQNCRLASVR